MVERRDPKEVEHAHPGGEQPHSHEEERLGDSPSTTGTPSARRDSAPEESVPVPQGTMPH
jgi:hypothetical protein